MGLSKELFTSLRDGLMGGLEIDRAYRERMINDEHRYTFYKKEKKKLKTKKDEDKRMGKKQ